MIEKILEQLGDLPVCEVDGQLRRVRRVIPAHGIGQAGSPDRCLAEPLSGQAGVIFADGGVLTQRELVAAEAAGAGCWRLPGPDGQPRLLRLFQQQQITSCLITVEQDGRVTHDRRRLYLVQAPGPEVQASAGTAASLNPAPVQPALPPGR